MGTTVSSASSSSRSRVRRYSSIEICAGAGGQALGLEQAGFRHLALIENDADACVTLRVNRPKWRVIEKDLREVGNQELPEYVDLLAGGVPCPPYSIAGAQLGQDDDRDLFPEVLRLAEALRPRGIMIENVKGLLQRKFTDYRAHLLKQLEDLGYQGEWALLTASDFGVPQLRPRSVLVALRPEDLPFVWPARETTNPPTVGALLRDSMEARGMRDVDGWARRAAQIAPTLVGGSKKHGGADLGPTRAKAAWLALGIDAKGVADEDSPIPRGRGHMPRLTVQQAALIQGFPTAWRIQGRKTSAYRQVGNAFPPPVARAVAAAIGEAWHRADASRS